MFSLVLIAMQLWKECFTYITTNQFFNLLNSKRNCNNSNNNNSRNNMLLISKQIKNIYNDCSSSLSSWFIKAILTAIYSYPLHVPYKAALKRTLATQFGFSHFGFFYFLARHVPRATRQLDDQVKWPPWTLPVP